MSIITDTLTKSGVNPDVAASFDVYYKLLAEWNEKINLTAITEEGEVATKHFLDCIATFKSDKLTPGCKVVDVGTGAGFPGLVLKIYDTGLDVTLVDSLNKRIGFLNEVISTLGLKGVQTVHSRAEDFGKDKAYREKYDVCVSRAVANLATLSELCLPLVKPGGYFVSLKGPKAAEELADAKKAIKLCGGELEQIMEYSVEGTDYEHNLVIIKKVASTPGQYPRKAPKPAKEPIK